MANNAILFDAAYSGSLIGLASRWVEPVSSGVSGSEAVSAAVAFATMVDAAIIVGTYSSSQADILKSLCQGVWNGRMPISSVPGDYSNVANSLVDIFALAIAQDIPVNSSAVVPYDNGDKAGPVSIDWSRSQKQFLGLSGDVTLTMSAPAGYAANYTLEVTEKGVGNFNITSWGANTRAAGGMGLDKLTSNTTVFSLVWNGTIFSVSSYSPSVSPAVTTLF